MAYNAQILLGTLYLNDFVHQEFASIELGDRRLSKRLLSVLQRMIDSPMQSIQSSCRGWAETNAAYRLFNNKKITTKAILAPHCEGLIERAKEHACVSVIQDTTELDYSKKKSLKGAGPLNSETRRGFLAHTQFVVSEGRLPLGVLDTSIYARNDEDFRKKRKHYPIEEKESYRWVQGYEKACDLAAKLPDTEVFSISDREGDIFELYQSWHQRKNKGKAAAQWLVRANQNRALLDQNGEPLPDEEEIRHLFKQVETGRELGRIEFAVKTRKQSKKVKGNRVQTTRSARQVCQSIKACKVTPRPPCRKGKKLEKVTFWIILAEEMNPPEGEEPIRWFLLTSKEINGFEDVQKIIKLYLTRWEIEVFHRVLKTGCKVEEIQLKGKQAVFNCVTLYMIVAWRILYLTYLGRQCPELPCSVFFEEAEWKSAVAVTQGLEKKSVLKKSVCNPHEPTLGEMLQIVAKFGGHLGRKNDHPPGAQALWQGLMRVRDFAMAWETFGR